MKPKVITAYHKHAQDRLVRLAKTIAYRAIPFDGSEATTAHEVHRSAQSPSVNGGEQ